MTQTQQRETPVERKARLAHERVLLAEADADLAADRYLTGDGELPSPEALRAKHRGR
jgi:hypothetical protein